MTSSRPTRWAGCWRESRADGTVAHRDQGDDARLLGYAEPRFRELICHPRLLPYLEAMLAQRGGLRQLTSPGYYLEHAYLMSMRTGDTGPWFHNGGTPHEPWWAYAVRDGRIHCGLVAVAWALTDAAAGDGGFWCIPGSHKASFPLPRAIETYQLVPACAHQPALRAGSMLIFTEALTHGTRDWRASHERVALFYKYSPAWLRNPGSRFWSERAADAALLTGEQRRYLPPGAPAGS